MDQYCRSLAAIASDSIPAVMSPRHRGHGVANARVLLKSAIERDVDGIVVTRRELCRYHQGRGRHTRFRRWWRSCAALTVRTRSLTTRTTISNVIGRRDDVAVVPADAQSIAISARWRNPDLRRVTRLHEPLSPPEREAANFVPDTYPSA